MSSHYMQSLCLSADRGCRLDEATYTYGPNVCVDLVRMLYEQLGIDHRVQDLYGIPLIPKHSLDNEQDSFVG